MDKRKILGGLLLLGAGGALWYAMRGKSVAAPGTASSLVPIGTSATIGKTLLPLGVPAGAVLMGYYTPKGAKHYNSIFYKSGSEYYDYNVNKKTVTPLPASTANVFINSPQFKKA